MSRIISINQKKKRGFAKALLMVTLIFLSIPEISANDITTQEPTSYVWTVEESGYDEAVFRSIQFINATHGWVAGRSSSNSWNGIILYTTDGGISWELQLHDESQEFSQLCIVDNRIIWVTAFGGLFFTNDSGNSWSYVDFLGIGTMFSQVGFFNRSIGWASTGQKLFKTIDGGRNWTECENWSFSDTLRMMFIHSESLIDGIGFDGIYHSINSGDSWEMVFDKGGWSLSFSTPDRGFAVADNMLAETSDGTTWIEMPIPMNSPIPSFSAQYLSDVLFIDKNHGWIVGDAVPVMYTPDGGVNWYTQSISTSVSRMMSVDFVNETHGWVAGFGGQIMRTTSGNIVGSRLWQGSTDPLFVSILSLIGVATIITTGIFLYRRRITQKIEMDGQGLEPT